MPDILPESLEFKLANLSDGKMPVEVLIEDVGGAAQGTSVDLFA